jgi:hypothetical protein
MARYFFHSTTGRTSRTLRALSLRALKDARDAAVVFMGKKLKDLDGNFWPGGLWSIRADETDATVCTIRVTGDQPAI